MVQTSSLSLKKMELGIDMSGTNFRIVLVEKRPAISLSAYELQDKINIVRCCITFSRVYSLSLYCVKVRTALRKM